MSGKLQKLRLDPGEIDVDAVEDRLIRQVAANRVRLREFFFDFDPLRSVRRVTALTIVMGVKHSVGRPVARRLCCSSSVGLLVVTIAPLPRCPWACSVLQGHCTQDQFKRALIAGKFAGIGEAEMQALADKYTNVRATLQ